MSKYLFIFLLLISCSTRDCKIQPNVTAQQKDTVKNNSDSSNKIESKSIMEQMQSLKETLSPGGQVRCGF